MRFATLSLVLSTVALLAPLSLSGQEAPTEGSAARDALPAVVTIRAYDASGDLVRFGSGFFLTDGRVVTNSHVVAGAEWVEIIDQEGDLLGSSPYAEVVSTRSDLAILPSLSTERVGLRVSPDMPQPAEGVWVVGSPEGLHGSVSSGVVSAVRSVDGNEYLQITAPISSGSSGGPILDSNGHVIGVVASYVTEGQNLNFGIPADQLIALVGSPPGEYAFGQMAGPNSQDERSSPETSSSSVDEVLDAVPALDIPDYIDGELTRSDFDANDRYVDLYTFRGESGQPVTLRMLSDEIDTYVAVTLRSQFGADDPWIREDDDGGKGTNSRVTATLPETGEYVVLAMSYDVEFGEYELALLEGSGFNSRGEQISDGDGRWQYAGTDSDSTDWYWDRSSVTEASGGHLEVWARLVHPDHSHIDISKQRWHLECDKRRVRAWEFVRYRNGDVVNQGRAPDRTWRDTPPETIGEAFMTAVCNAYR